MAEARSGTPSRAIQALAIAGPTASGKTAAALALAEALQAHGGAEIISVDSALVYRGMDIGTAKPSPAERQRVPHHLIDIREPNETYSAAEFAREAASLIEHIRARGRWPVLVGGTMLYFKALMQGLSALPAADAAVRAEIEAQARRAGWPSLHAELARIDPASAARLAPNDSQRIQRALEVFRVSGQTLTTLHQTTTPMQAGLGAQIALVSLEPRERSWLHARIAERFEAMLQAGFVDEVRTLMQRPELHPELPALRAVGYRQAWQMLAEHKPEAWLHETGIAATRQLAKRQLTWLRSLPERHTVPCDAPNAMTQLVPLALHSLGVAKAPVVSD